ncbi:MAG: FAD-dependent monooxygenase, partial [Methylobacteriaceae bacterium]|nr:FAD-dependent monooxygenase [Methylobacteriaceae bacterium]
MAKTGVLIVGAGPTGLNLALQLARRGIPARLIEAHDGPGERSRAMGVHARTLEFYRQLGFADEMVADGIEAHRFNLREGRADGDGRVVASVTLEEIGAGLSPYPFMLAYPQDRHERFLIGKLEEAGGRVEWQTKLVGFEDVGSQVQARIVGPNGAEEAVDAAYLCGCDGAHSRVRETLGIGFPGGTYEQLFYVADVKIASGFERDIIANIGEHSLALMFPVRAAGMQRLIGLVRPELSHRTDLTFEEIRGEVEPLVGVEVTEVNWFSTYRVHHRVAERFRVGRAFLLGDAGHIHSPAGGQGMNTGIGDAMNLGWKLADVLRGRASAEILDTYEPERIAFARSLVATTDRAFTPMIAESWTGELFRRVVAPLVLSVATR